MLREDLKKELDKLNDEQLKKIADFIAIEFQSKRVEASVSLGQNATPLERAQEFREWVLRLSKSSRSLPDEAFNRDSIYE